MLSTSDLVTNAKLNEKHTKKTDYSTRIVEDENEILDITDLVTTPALNAKSYRI